MRLRSDFTFDTFVRTPSSATPRRLCRAMVRGSGPKILLLHGPTGGGKTHLLHALVHARAARSPVRVRVTSAAELTQEIVEAIRDDRLARYQQPSEIELLIVDDLHLFRDRPATQTTLGQTLGAWASQGMWICGASSVHVAVLGPLTGAIRRATSLRSAELMRPANAERRALVVELASRTSTAMPSKAVTQAARECGGDVRRILGVLAHRRAMAKLPGARTAPPWMQKSHSC